MRTLFPPLDPQAAGLAGAEGLPQVQELPVELAPDAPAQGRPLPQRPGPGSQVDTAGADIGGYSKLTRHYFFAILP